MSLQVFITRLINSMATAQYYSSKIKKTGKCFWTVIVDDRIRELVPTDQSEKPDLQALFENTETQVLVFKRTGAKEDKSHFGFYPDTKNMWRFRGEEFATIKTKNIKNFTCYGIDLSYADKKTRGIALH